MCSMFFFIVKSFTKKLVGVNSLAADPPRANQTPLQNLPNGQLPTPRMPASLLCRVLTQLPGLGLHQPSFFF